MPWIGVQFNNNRIDKIGCRWIVLTLQSLLFRKKQRFLRGTPEEKPIKKQAKSENEKKDKENQKSKDWRVRMDWIPSDCTGLDWIEPNWVGVGWIECTPLDVILSCIEWVPKRWIPPIRNLRYFASKVWISIRSIFSCCCPRSFRSPWYWFRAVLYIWFRSSHWAFWVFCSDWIPNRGFSHFRRSTKADVPSLRA